MRKISLGCGVVDIQPNPSEKPELVAALLSNGTLKVINFKEDKAVFENAQNYKSASKLVHVVRSNLLIHIFFKSIVE
jgi:hypothetical protein